MTPEKKEKMKKVLKIVLIVLLVLAIFNVLFDDRRHGYENKTENIISVSGHAEVSAVPDIANIYFTIRQEAKTVKEAQTSVAKIEKQALDILRKDGVADKDIKTASASFNPKYEYKYGAQVICVNQYNCPPPAGKNVIVGYEAYESITVKVRNTDDTGKIMQELGAVGISELSGPSFAVDNEDSLKAEARKKAINDAKAKAKVLAKDLGIELGKMTSFNENSNNPVPMYAKTMMVDSAMESAPAELPKGENTITSDVTITYQIK